MNSKVTYRQQYTRCGKQRCRKCREGAGHGPYWYAYWSEKGRTVSKYIGTRLPEHVETAQQPTEDATREPNRSTNTVGITGIHIASDPALRIYLLGQFRIERKSGNEWVAVDSRTWHRRRARALLGCLLSSPGRRLGREQVMELLWPDLDIDVAANRLNGAVHELRQILEPEIARPAASRMLRLEREILELADSTQIWVDAERFEHLLKEAYATIELKQVEHLLEEATSLYKGSYLLEELYSEWASPRRDALQRAWVGLLLNLANLRAEQGAYASAIEILDRLRTAEPTNETALQRLMILLTQLDRRGEALQVYRQHIVMLEKDYEGEPLPETLDLYETLRRGHLPNMYTIKPQTNPTKEPKETEANTPPVPGQEQQAALRQEVSFPRPLFQLGRHNQSPLIGRNTELASMRQLLLAVEAIPARSDITEKGPIDQALPAAITSPSRTKRPHFILLRGEAGIGKTRLAEELSLEAYTRGWAVAWSRSYEQEGTIPYHPWTELLRTLLYGTTTLTNLPGIAMTGNGSGAHAHFKPERLSALLPELADASLPTATRPIPPLPHEQERLHLWEAALGLLELLGKTHPLLLVLDDLHWTDDSSIELLTYLTHHLQDQRILLIGTCREGELSPQHKLRTLIADLCREQAIVTISINPLTHSQIGTLVSHLPQDMVQSIQTQAAGNPFFAEELARYVGTSVNDREPLIPLTPNQQTKLTHPPLNASSHRPSLSTPSQPGESRSHGSLPEPIAAVLERRLSRLSNDCQILLGKAAVLGGSFELNQLLPMANEHNEDSILDLLEEALHAGLLTEEGNGAHITYYFWHPLIISHLYERISAARRAQLHRRAAEAIKVTSTQQEKSAAAIVYHLSRGGGNSAQVAYYAELAGSQAYSLAAYSEAQQYYLQAIQSISSHEIYPVDYADISTQIRRALPQLLSRYPLPDPLHICRLLEHVAECCMVLGNSEEARRLYECILALRTPEAFSQQAYPSLLSDEEKRQQEAQIQALLWREIGNTWAATGDYTRAYEYYRHGKEVMFKANVTTGAAWACLHLQYGEMLRVQGHYHQARHYLQEALEMLERVVESTEPGRNQAFTTNNTYNTHNPQAFPPKDLQTRTERALIGDPLEIGYAHERLGIVAASVGQLSEALQHMHIALRIYEQSELVSEMARVCSNLGAAYATKGDQGSARDHMQRSLNLAERTGDLPNMTLVMGNLGDLAHRTGDLLESERWFQRSLALAESINDRERISWFAVELAAVQQDLGNLKEAATNLYRAISIGRDIKSARCIRYALVGLGNLRIVDAIIACQFPSPFVALQTQLPERGLSLLRRGTSTLQRAISHGELEVEAIIAGKHHLATLYFLRGETEIAHQIALQALKEAQENEMIRMIGCVYRLLGSIIATQENYEQADYCFEQALKICREHELRLDYARALHGYGASLVLRSRASQQAVNAPWHVEDATYQQGLSYLQEARAVFATCSATLDLSWVEHFLPLSEPENVASH